MTTENAINALNAGAAAWKKFSQKERTAWNGTVRRDKLGKEVKVININKNKFESKKFNNFFVEGIAFQDVDFVSCEFNHVIISVCTFTRCTFTRCDFSGADISCAEFLKCRFKNSSFANANLNEQVVLQGRFEWSNFTDARVLEGNFQGSELSHCNMCGVKFGRSNLTEVVWEKCTIDKNTDFESSNLNSDIITRDKSETTEYVVKLRNVPFNWRSVRSVGNFPILGFSWTVFLSSLFLINTVVAINQMNPPLFEGMELIPVPHDALWILAGSLLLALGSTIFSVCCPEEVKSFSETEWVYEHKHPRMEYLVRALQRPLWQAVSIITLMSGMLISLWLVGRRIFDAVKYFVPN